MAAMICFNMGWQHMSILSQTIASMNYFDHHTTFANASTFFQIFEYHDHRRRHLHFYNFPINISVLFLFLPCNCLLHHVEDYAMTFGLRILVELIKCVG